MQPRTSILGLALAATTATAISPFLNATVEHGVNTECKTCPYSLCPNKATYKSDEGVTLTCWTKGDSIDRGGPQGDDLWLKTKDQCYIADYDLKDYGGSYEEDLAYCGLASEAKNITQAPVSTKYNTECQVCPSISCDNVAYHKYGIDLNSTCYTDSGEDIVGDKTWLKTTQNCYVSQSGLVSKANKTALDKCGPIPFLQYNQTAKGTPSPAFNSTTFIPTNSTSNFSTSTTTMFSTATETATSTVISTTFAETTAEPTATMMTLQPEAVPTILSRGTIPKRYLQNFTVADTAAVCRSCRSTDATKCTHIKEYAKDKGVVAQCYATVQEDTAVAADKGMWLFTVDFCWVKEGDFVAGERRGHYRFPECNKFK